MVQFPGHFIAKSQDFLDTFETLMHERRAFEIHFSAEALSRTFRDRNQLTPAGPQKFRHALRLPAILGVAHGILTRPEAFVYLVVNASRLRWTRFEIVL